MNTHKTIARAPEGSGRPSTATRGSPPVAPASKEAGIAGAGDAVMCENGVSRSFGKFDIGTSGLLSGWAVPEEAHVWNDGPEVVLKVRTPTSQGSLHVTFEGTPFLNASCDSQDVTLYANGYFVGFWRLTEQKDYQIRVTLEPEQLHHRDGTAVIKLIWYVPHSVRPSEVAAGNDTRELGFCFHAISVTEAT